MPYRLDIPGQVSEFQLRAIEAVATLVPGNGCVVEVGSLFGSSSWAWANSVPASAHVFCVDPWEANEGVRTLEKTHGVKYGIDQFRRYTQDCPNLTAIKAYSPDGVRDWDRPVDLYYEDAVHTDPVLGRNIAFWSGKLTPNGIICGDDYRPRFGDVRAAAEAAAGARGRKLWIVDYFWCVLPPADAVPGVAAVEATLARLADEAVRARNGKATVVRVHPLMPIAATDAGFADTRFRVRVVNDGALSWPATPAGDLRLEARLHDEAGAVLGTSDVPLGTDQLRWDEPRDLMLPLPPLDALPPVLRLQLRIKGAGAEAGVMVETFEQTFRFTPPPVERVGAKPPAAPVATPSPVAGAFDFADRRAWLRYVGDRTAQEIIGIQPTAHQTFRLRGRETLIEDVRSMLSIYELGVLYALARDHWSGRGAIIDAGPLLGASTFALARGLQDNARVEAAARRNAIYAYDLWIADDYYTRFINGADRGPRTPSLLPEFLKVNREHLDMIVPHQGDFAAWTWPDAPIEILFMDLAKTWDLNQHYVRTMLPRLVEDGVVVQREYVHFNAYWLHITMEYFADHFALSDALYGATAFFRVTRLLTAAQCRVDLKALPYERKADLLRSARAKMPPGVRQVMKCAAAKCAVEHGRLDEAERLLADVDMTITPASPVENFTGIARSNHAAVTRLIEAAGRARPAPAPDAPARMAAAGGR